MTEVYASPIMQQFTQSISPEKLAGIDLTVQLKLSGEGGGDWYVEIHDGKTDLYKGITDTAGVSLESSLEDFRSLVEGRLDAAQAFMSGRLRVQGNILLLLKLAALMNKSA